MKARYQFRFYPTDQQKQSLAQLFGCVRVVWNDALALCKQSEKKPKSAELQKLVITQAKQTIERAWLSEVSNIPLQLKIAKLHNQIADTRKDFLHKLSTKIVSENQTIVLEDLNVSKMVKNRRLARAISQQGWYEFRSLCEGKSEKFGRDLRVISPWEPTSQICSDCGFRWGKLALKVRSVQCLNCGNEHDRDQNAAKIINKVGTGHCHDCKRTQRQSRTTFGSVSR